jgi:hypothetical protein
LRHTRAERSAQWAARQTAVEAATLRPEELLVRLVGGLLPSRRTNRRRYVREREGPGLLIVEYLDVNRRTHGPFRRSKHELTVRLRAATLGRDDPEGFFAVVRDSQQRERSGADPVDALEQALDAANA